MCRKDIATGRTHCFNADVCPAAHKPTVALCSVRDTDGAALRWKSLPHSWGRYTRERTWRMVKPILPALTTQTVHILIAKETEE